MKMMLHLWYRLGKQEKDWYVVIAHLLILFSLLHLALVVPITVLFLFCTEFEVDGGKIINILMGLAYHMINAKTFSKLHVLFRA